MNDGARLLSQEMQVSHIAQIISKLLRMIYKPLGPSYAVFLIMHMLPSNGMYVDILLFMIKVHVIHVFAQMMSCKFITQLNEFVGNDKDYL